MNACDELNALLKADDATGELARKTADGTPVQAILLFAGKNAPQPMKFGPFMEETMVDGELIRIGGKDKIAHATIIDPEGKIWPGELSRELAREMAPCLYQGAILRVTGNAKWERDENSVWNLVQFKISSFEILENDTLQAATTRLRQLRGTDLGMLDDIDNFIATERGEGSRIH